MNESKPVDLATEIDKMLNECAEAHETGDNIVDALPVISLLLQVQANIREKSAEVESLRERVKELEGDQKFRRARQLLRRAYKLIDNGILSEDGGDPEAGLMWLYAVDAFNEGMAKINESTKGNQP